MADTKDQGPLSWLSLRDIDIIYVVEIAAYSI